MVKPPFRAWQQDKHSLCQASRSRWPWAKARAAARPGAFCGRPACPVVPVCAKRRTAMRIRSSRCSAPSPVDGSAGLSDPHLLGIFAQIAHLVGHDVRPDPAAVIAIEKRNTVVARTAGIAPESYACLWIPAAGGRTCSKKSIAGKSQLSLAPSREAADWVGRCRCSGG